MHLDTHHSYMVGFLARHIPSSSIHIDRHAREDGINATGPAHKCIRDAPPPNSIIPGL